MTGLSHRGACALLAVATTTIMVGCVVVPGLPAIAAALGVGNAAGWLVTVPSLGVILFASPAAWLIERAGNRRALCIGLFAYGALGAAGMLLRGPWAVFGDRLLLGGATALVMAAGTGCISDFYTGAARLSMIARQGMAIELGGVVFLFAGGLLASAGWRWPFLLYLAGWVLLAMVLAWVPAAAPRAAPGRADAAGAEAPAPLRRVRAAALLAMALFFTAVIELPARLRGFGFDAAQTGAFLSFVSLVAVAAAAVLPRLVARAGAARVLAAGFGCFALGHACFALAWAPAPMLAGAVATGTGFGLCIPLVNALTVERSAPALRARALAYLSMALFAGQFLSSFVVLLGGAATVFGSAAGAGTLAALAAACAGRASARAA